MELFGAVIKSLCNYIHEFKKVQICVGLIEHGCQKKKPLKNVQDIWTDFILPAFESWIRTMSVSS